MAALVAKDTFFSCYMMKDTNSENGPGPGKGNEVSPVAEMVCKNPIQTKHNPKYTSVTMQPRKLLCIFSLLLSSKHVSALAGHHQVLLLFMPDDGQLGLKHVVKKGEHTNKFSRLHCDGSSVNICKIMQQDA
jgi:hypothetical protein